MSKDEATTRVRERQHNQIRTLVCELSALERADGSAKWTQDTSSVLAAVYGPRQAGQRKEDSEKAVVEVIFKPRSGLQTSQEKEYEGVIREALEGVLLLGQFPRTSIQVTLQVLSDDGSVLAVALNAACAALVDAGVQLKSCYASVAAAISSPTSTTTTTASSTGPGQLLMDPDAAEFQRASQVLTLAFPIRYDSRSSEDGETSVHIEEGSLLCHSSRHQEAGMGGMTQDEFLDAYDACRLSCGQIAGFMRTAFVKALS